jgi:hypothetical protein
VGAARCTHVAVHHCRSAMPIPASSRRRASSESECRGVLWLRPSVWQRGCSHQYRGAAPVSHKQRRESRRCSAGLLGSAVKESTWPVAVAAAVSQRRSAARL